MAKFVKKSTVENWRSELDANNKWLTADFTDDGKGVLRITCSVCTEYENKIMHLRNFSRSAIEGFTGSAIKKDGLVKHSNSEPHKRALSLKDPKSLTLDQIFEKTPIGRSMACTKSIEEEQVGKLFDISYMLAREELPFTKFEVIAQLETKHGVDVRCTYLNEVKCAEFTTIIGENLREEMLQTLRMSNYLTLLIDGATDSAVSENEMIYCLFMDSKTGEVNFRFLDVAAVENARAYGIKNTLENVFVAAGLSDFKTRMIGFMADGASVNMGEKSGLVGRLKRENDMPWLISVHCLNHRLELAMKDAFSGNMMKDVTEMLETLYRFYNNSPKRLRELRELAEIMEEKVRKPERATGTRWVQFKRRACATLSKSYAIIIGHLENLAEDGSTKAEEKARIKGYLNKLKRFQFIATLLFLSELLEPISKLSLCLQGDGLDFLHAMAALKRTDDKLYELKGETGCQSEIGSSTSKKAFSSGLNKLILDAQPHSKISDLSIVHDPSRISPMSNTQESPDVLDESANSETTKPNDEQVSDRPIGVFFRGVRLTNVTTGLANFESQKPKMIAKIINAMDKRFYDLRAGIKDTHFSALKLLDTSLWPSDNDELKVFGNSDLSLFIDQFKVLLERKGVDVEVIEGEWGQLKAFFDNNMRHLKYQDVWKSVIVSHREQFPNLVHVIEILKIYPVSYAKVERGFSALNRVKSDWRSRLGTVTLAHLLRISLEGPELSKFDSSDHVRHFFSAKRRYPNMLPYGPREKKAKDDNEETQLNSESVI